MKVVRVFAIWTGGKRLAPKVGIDSRCRGREADKGKELPSRLGLVPYLLHLIHLLVHSLDSVKNTQVTQLGRHASYALIVLYCQSRLAPYSVRRNSPRLALDSIPSFPTPIRNSDSRTTSRKMDNIEQYGEYGIDSVVLCVVCNVEGFDGVPEL